MWKAFLKIKDGVNHVEKTVEYKFYKVTTYLNLFHDLYLVYPKFKKEYEVEFKFNYLDNSTLIDDLSKYILNNDKIEIIINKCKPMYYLYDPIFKDEIVQCYNIKKLYEYADKNIVGEILLYVKRGCIHKLVDVLTKPDYYKSECINRLMKKYNY